MSALNRLRGQDEERAKRQGTLVGNQNISEVNGLEEAWVLARHGVGQPAP
jgi:hypothetical protein